MTERQKQLTGAEQVGHYAILASGGGVAEKQILREGSLKPRYHLTLSKEKRETPHSLGTLLAGKPRVVSEVRIAAVKQGRPKGKERRKGKKGMHHIGIARSMATLMPDEVLVEMPYVEALWIASAGATGFEIRRQVNALYDPDPAVGGSSFVGLAAWAALYTYYRVLEYRYEVTVCNEETATGMLIQVANTNTDPGTSMHSTLAYSVLPYCQSTEMTLANGGGSRHVFRKRIHLSQLLGSNAFEMDDNFRGLTASANPVDLVWISVSASVTTGTMTAVGVKGELKVWAKTRLYDRVRVTS